MLFYFRDFIRVWPSGIYFAISPLAAFRIQANSLHSPRIIADSGFGLGVGQASALSARAGVSLIHSPFGFRPGMQYYRYIQQAASVQATGGRSPRSAGRPPFQHYRHAGHFARPLATQAGPLR